MDIITNDEERGLFVAISDDANFSLRTLAAILGSILFLVADVIFVIVGLWGSRTLFWSLLGLLMGSCVTMTASIVWCQW